MAKRQAIINLWVMAILSRTKTKDDIPEKLRKDVLEELSKRQ